MNELLFVCPCIPLHTDNSPTRLFFSDSVFMGASLLIHHCGIVTTKVETHLISDTFFKINNSTYMRAYERWKVAFQKNAIDILPQFTIYKRSYKMPETD